jgi:hypothetical protein
LRVRDEIPSLRASSSFAGFGSFGGFGLKGRLKIARRFDVGFLSAKPQVAAARPGKKLAEIRKLQSTVDSAILLLMSNVKEIESALANLTMDEKQAVRDWLDDLIEEQLEVSDEFKAKAGRAKQEIARGVYSRRREPEAGQ